LTLNQLLGIYNATPQYGDSPLHYGDNRMNSIQKTFKILELLQHNPGGIRTGEISKKLGITVPTVCRLLGHLKDFGYVQRNFFNNKYVLGKAAFELGKRTHQHHEAQLITIADPLMKKLSADINESVILEIGVSNGVIIIHRIFGSQPVQVIISPGTIIPYHVSPGGKCMLSFMDEKDAEQIFSGEINTFTSKTITDKKILRKSLKKIRELGFATTVGEFIEGTTAYASPILVQSNKCIGAIVVSMPTFRADKKNEPKLIAQLKETTAAIGGLCSQLQFGGIE